MKQKMLVVRLQSSTNHGVFIGHEMYTVIDETEETYEIDLALSNVFINSKKFIPKAEMGEPHYHSIFSTIDDKEYWFFDTYAFVLIGLKDKDEERITIWREKLREVAMTHIKALNTKLRPLYKEVEALC